MNEEEVKIKGQQEKAKEANRQVIDLSKAFRLGEGEPSAAPKDARIPDSGHLEMTCQLWINIIVNHEDDLALIMIKHRPLLERLFMMQIPGCGLRQAQEDFLKGFDPTRRDVLSPPDLYL